MTRKRITAQRVATAWVGRDVLLGGEKTSLTKDSGTTTQFHPATVQWRTPTGKIGWVRLVQSPVVDATADRDGLSIVTQGDVRFRLHAEGMDVTKIVGGSWHLPGLQVGVTTDAKGVKIERTADGVDLVYAGMTHMRLDVRGGCDGRFALMKNLRRRSGLALVRHERTPPPVLIFFSAGGIVPSACRGGRCPGIALCRPCVVPAG